MTEPRARSEAALGSGARGPGEQESLFPDLITPALQYTTGVLPEQEIALLIERERITAAAPIESGQIQPASIDLRLGAVAYRVAASFLPGKHHTVAARIAELAVETIDLTSPRVLKRGQVYLVPLMESLALAHDCWAKANPKSSTGRLDIFTRLITDRGEAFEAVPAGYRGPLYAEIAPRTFNVRVRMGTRLNQLRFVRGTPRQVDDHLHDLHTREHIVFGPDSAPVDPRISDGLWLSVDLLGESRGSEIVGYQAKKTATVIDLSQIAHYAVADFWTPVLRRPDGRLILEHDAFYILVSKERVRIPPSHAADMAAYDASVGEFRVHYAGFFDPGFGHFEDRSGGTPAVLEVRSHEVPFLLEDGQIVARLVYERLLAPPVRAYGTGIGSSYQSQGLTLSKHFKRG